jgi:hypothetical protein
MARSRTTLIRLFTWGLTLGACASGCQESDPVALEMRDGGPGQETPTRPTDGLDQRENALDAADVPDSTGETEPLPHAGIDLSPACVEGAQQLCASPGNPLVGACRGGVRICEGGAWSPCSEVLPAGGESCNGVDDNCNGMTDEGCAAGCLVVCAGCSDDSRDGAEPDGSLGRPYATLEAAIAAAAASSVDGGTRSRICVAGGRSCSEAWTYQSPAPITIPDGLIVQGGYAAEPTGLVYCDAPLRPKTTLRFTSNQGVLFDQRVVTGAELGGFAVSISTAATEGFTDPTVAIAVSGARNVSLSRIFVSDEMAGARTHGVSITDGGHATIIRSSINTGQGRVSAIGVYVNGGTVDLRHNCDDLLAGHCTSKCTDCGPQLGIRGYVAAGPLDAPAQSSAVYITGPAGSSMVGNMVCGGSSNLAGDASPVKAAAVLCEGPGCSSVSGNLIVGGSDRHTVGLALVGTAPWVDGNRVEGGCGAESTTGVWLESSSARLQNNRILGGQCGGSDSPVFHGLHVRARASTDDPDVHSNAIEPLGLPSDCESVGILLERTPGLETEPAGAVRNNVIAAGTCNHRTAVGEAAGAPLQLRSLMNNDLYDPTSDPATGTLVLYRHGDADATTTAQVNAQPGASGNISVDPKYAAYLSDFRLTSESACIDRGAADGAPDTDGDGNQRPVGKGYDIGAYEFWD